MKVDLYRGGGIICRSDLAGRLAKTTGEMSPAFAEGVRLERERVRAILDAPEAAAGRRALAISLATDTDLAAEAAIAVLRSAPMSRAEASTAAEFYRSHAEVGAARDREATSSRRFIDETRRLFGEGKGKHS